MTQQIKKTTLTNEDINEIYKNEQIEGFKASISFAVNAARGAFILNGGAALALLTFTGNIISKNDKYYFNEYFLSALTNFAVGVLCAALVSACAYIAQSGYMQKGYEEQGREYYYPFFSKIAAQTQSLALITYGASIVLFCLGIYDAGKGLLQFSL